MIRVEIQNVKSKLSGDLKLLNRLYKELSFKHPDAFFIQKKLRYKWDGMVYPLSNKGFLDTGLLEFAIKKLIEYGETEFEVVDLRRIPEYIGVPDKVGDFVLRDYQKEAVELFGSHELLEAPHPRGIFLHAVNSGKTLIMFAIHKSYRDARTIILLESSILYKQIKEDLIKAFGDEAGYMQGKSVKWAPIMVVMVKTLRNRLKEYKEKLLDYNILLTDEADLALSKTFKDVYKSLSHMSIRAGFTGTAFLRNLKKDRLRNFSMVSTFGEVIHEIEMKDLEEMGHSTKTIIKLIKGPPFIQILTNFHREFEEGVVYNRDVHKLVLKRVKYNLKRGKSHILIITKYIKQAEELYLFLKDKVSVPIDYTHHMRVGDRVEAFKRGDLTLLISTLYIKRGLNLPLTDVIISVADGEFYTNPIQVIGRGVRKHSSKDIFIYEDILLQGQYLSRHGKQRISYYKKIKLEIRDYT